MTMKNNLKIVYEKKFFQYIIISSKFNNALYSSNIKSK